MRFGKRGKTWAAMGRLFGEAPVSVPENTSHAALPPDPEENALEPEPEVQAMAAPETRDNPMGQNDPTQSLFSSLGRFCRHFTRAQSIPNSNWPSECMQELTASLRVCLDQNWTSLQRALIDTARILSSYEGAGRAADSLPFLQKSHDILSLMVGDLILDRVADLGRYGWPEHYARAVAALRERGIELVEDDADDAEAAYEPVPIPPPVFSARPTAPAVAQRMPAMPMPQEPELSEEPEPEPEEMSPVAEPELEAQETAFDEEPPAAEAIAEPEPEPAPEPAAPPVSVPVHVAEETVEALNAAVQQTLRRGDVAQAKTLAIRLAAALARREIDTAQDNLVGARNRLDMNGVAIAEGEQRVSDAETRVLHAETEISARQAESQACRERIDALDTEIQKRRQEVADLDIQIQTLQERRAAEAAALHERESERAASVAGESLIQTEIESLNEEEDAAREFLEAARAKLDTMRAERIRIEDEIAAICTDVERRKRSVRTIERPLFCEDEEEEEKKEKAAEEKVKEPEEKAKTESKAKKKGKDKAKEPEEESAEEPEQQETENRQETEEEAGPEEEGAPAQASETEQSVEPKEEGLLF